jgi:formate C-acetyltransferase
MQVMTTTVELPWRAFHAGLWQTAIDVRDFIQQNYTPYDGDSSFLAPATPRTKQIWGKLNELFIEERKRGVLDISQCQARLPPIRPATSTASRKSSSACRPTRR